MNYLYIGLLKKSEMGLIEPSQKDNYHRIELGPGDLEFNGDCVINIVEITFPEAKKHWGLITHFGIWDSLQKGHLLAIGNLEKRKTINKYDIVQFKPNSIEISPKELGIEIEK